MDNEDKLSPGMCNENKKKREKCQGLTAAAVEEQSSMPGPLSLIQNLLVPQHGT